MLAVVIVNYNAGQDLAANICALARALPDAPWQAAVVDNGSEDDSMDAVRTLRTAGLPLTLIENGGNLGFARACNIGARAVEGEWLLFLNPDVEVPPGTIERVTAVLEADPQAALAGCLLRNPDGSEQRGCRRSFPDPRSAFYRLSGLAALFPERFPDFNRTGEPLPDGPVAVDAVSGAFMLMRRAAFERVGGWDEGYFLHMEDLDLCRRLKEGGYKVLFVPDVSAVHDQGICSRARPIRVEWHKHRSMWRYHRRFDAARSPFLVNLLVPVGIAAHFLVRAAGLLLKRG